MGVVAVIWSPVQTLREVAEGRGALPGFIVVAVYAALGLIVSTISVLGGVTRRALEQQAAPGFPPGFWDTFTRAIEISVPISALLSPFLLWIFVSLSMQLVTRFFGGTGPLSAMLGVVGVAQVPFFISGVLSFLITSPQLFVDVQEQIVVALGYVVSLIGLVFFVWHVVLVVTGAAQARNIGYGESAGSCAISCVGLAFLIILVVVVVGFGVFVTVSAAAPQ